MNTWIKLRYLDVVVCLPLGVNMMWGPEHSGLRWKPPSYCSHKLLFRLNKSLVYRGLELDVCVCVCVCTQVHCVFVCDCVNVHYCCVQLNKIEPVVVYHGK